MLGIGTRALSRGVRRSWPLPRMPLEMRAAHPEEFVTQRPSGDTAVNHAHRKAGAA